MTSKYDTAFVQNLLNEDRFSKDNPSRPETEEKDLSKWANDYLDDKEELDFDYETPYQYSLELETSHGDDQTELTEDEAINRRKQLVSSNSDIFTRLDREKQQNGHASNVLTSELKKANRRLSTTNAMMRLEAIQQVTGNTTEDIEKLDINEMPVEQRLHIQSEYIKRIEKELNNEVIAKKRLLTYLRNTEKKSEAQIDYTKSLEIKLQGKDTLVKELRDEVKSLEIQLGLMDEKCLNLKIKVNNMYKSNMKKQDNDKKLNATNFQKSQTRLASTGSFKGTLPDLNIATGQGSSTSNLFHHHQHVNDIGSLESDEHNYDLESLDDSEGKNNFSKSFNSSHQFKSGLHHNSNSNIQVTSPEVMLVKIEDKLRKKEGRKPNWTPDKLKSLIGNG